MAHFKSPNYNQCLFECISENSNYDVKLIPNDSKSIIQAHKIILASASDYFYKIFKDLPNSDNEVIIQVPDFNFHSINLIINFIYMGEIEINTNDLNVFLEICNLFSLKSFDRPLKMEEEEEEVAEVNVCESPTTLFTTNNDPKLLVEQNIDGNLTDTTIGLETQCNDNNYPEIVGQNSDTELLPSIENIIDDYDVTSSFSTEMQMDSAVEELKSGSNVKEISLKYRIPRSTLYVRAQKYGIPIRRETNRSSTFKKYKYLNEAMNSIIKNGMSYKKASKTYKIPATMLWRHAKKLMSGEQRITNISKNKHKAIQELQNGNLSLKDLYKKYQISISTLYREKRKLFMEGKLSNDSTLKQTRFRATNYENMEKAYDAFSKGMKQSRAAALYNIPKTSFYRYIKKQQSIEASKSSMATEADIVIDCDTTDSENYYGS